jgi:hypothetical protein
VFPDTPRHHLQDRWKLATHCFPWTSRFARSAYVRLCVKSERSVTSGPTGITAYLKNGGTLEKAAAMANHASTRTTQLYDRRRDELSLDEVERIVI